jgi:Cu-processing system permease protein
MNLTAKIARYELRDVVRGKSTLAYMGFFLLVTDALFRFGGGSAQALLSLTNVVLIVVPLVAGVFGTMYLYNARAFNELLLAQPVDRRSLFLGLFAGLALPLAGAFVVGVGFPFVLHGVGEASQYRTLAVLLGAGVMLTWIFVALAFALAVRFEEKVKGLGLAMLLWLVFAVVYDGLVLLVVTLLADYPLEKPLLALMLLNPVDLARVLLLLSFDIAALMGYTGAVFERFFGSALGALVAGAALTLWLVVPFWLGLRWFEHKDF